MSGQFSRSAYDRRREAFGRLRSSGTGVSGERKKIDEWSEWSVDNIGSNVGSVKADWNKVLESAIDYTNRCALGSGDAINGDVLKMSYNVYGDIKRPVGLGEPTQGLEYVFKWTRLDVNVQTRAGIPRPNAPSQDLDAAVKTDARDRSSVSRATGWDRQACTNMTTDDVTTFINLARVAMAGGNRLTRLVKGFLLYMDLLEGGSKNINIQLDKLVEYKPDEVLKAYRTGGNSYAYCSQATSPEHVAVLKLIGGAYPNAHVPSTCHVNIPADGDHHVVVRGSTTMLIGSRKLTLTSNGVYSALVKYAAEVGSADELELAMIIASTLYQNRYLSTVDLPAVNSTPDLLIPAMVYNDVAVSSRPHVNKNTLYTIGRLHQMCILLMIKDVVIAAKVSTRHGMDYRRTAMQWLGNYDILLNRYSVDATALRLVEATSVMKWSYLIDEDGLDDIDEMTMFECLWLCEDGKKCIKNGGIIMLKNAIKDGSRGNPYLGILADEIRKAQMVYDTSRLPDGDFSVAGRCVAGDEHKQIERKRFTKVVVKEKKRQERKPKRRKRHGDGMEVSGEVYESSLEEIRQSEPSPNRYQEAAETLQLSVRTPARTMLRKAAVATVVGQRVESKSRGRSGSRSRDVKSVFKKAEVRDQSESSSGTSEASYIRKVSERSDDLWERETLRSANAVSDIHVSDKESVAAVDEEASTKVVDKEEAKGTQGGKYVIKRRASEMPPREVFEEEERLKRYAVRLKTKEEASGTMEERLARVDELRKDARVEATQTTNYELGPAAMYFELAGVQPGTKALGTTMTRVYDKIIELGGRGAEMLMEDGFAAKLTHRLAGTTIPLARINDMALILESVDTKGDMLCVRKTSASGRNYLYSVSDSKLLSITIQGLIKSGGRRWLLEKNEVMLLASEFNLGEYEWKTLSNYARTQAD